MPSGEWRSSWRLVVAARTLNVKVITREIIGRHEATRGAAGKFKRCLHGKSTLGEASIAVALLTATGSPAACAID